MIPEHWFRVAARARRLIATDGRCGAFAPSRPVRFALLFPNGERIQLDIEKSDADWNRAKFLGPDAIGWGFLGPHDGLWHWRINGKWSTTSWR